MTVTVRIGEQTPTRSLILPYNKSLGSEAIELYEKSGRTAFDWQRFIVDAILAKNEQGLWVHMNFGYSVPRQNGKNEIVAMRERLGLDKGERILHTAHRTTTSAAAFNRLLAVLEESGLEDGEDFHKIKATGRESIELFGGGRVDFRTRTSTGGLGESFDLLVIDEAQEYTDDQRSALMYTIAASPNPQTIYTGTPPTPISSGTVFTRMRDNALQGSVEETGWAEWSVDKQSDVRDKDLWYQANPSLGLRVSERNIQAEVGDDDIDFNIQRLGLWIQYNQKSAISENEWKDLHVDTLPWLTGKIFAGIKYGYDGTNVALSIAVKTVDDKVFVETIDCQSLRNGHAWIIHFLKNADVQEVVIDGANGQNILAEAMKQAGLKKPILPTVKEIIVSNSMFEQALFQQMITHKSQPSLFQVVTNCDKRNIGTQGGFGYRSQIEENDIALMESMILAHWACSEAKPPKKQKIRY
ncbi:terminase [Oceanobacillus arenosus]|uniref:Terminase n=1 Tax=Oceanobacillus arenosus TaxID=1229153 RepID=A0A3D8PY08_9BACI|nr:terminase [Oceanobacillus arenosus]RDW21030.1 terminase [Oceanobacillus arenosus]